eukprot:3023393-Karenia_brevis.AAC.1
MGVADGFFDPAPGKSYLSALPDEYIARAIVDADVPDMFKSVYSIGATPWIFDITTEDDPLKLPREVL